MNTAAGDIRYQRELNPAAPDALARIAQRLPPGSTVLDVGTGPGPLGRALHGQGCTVDGVERDAERLVQARPYYRHLLRADLATEGWPARLPERYDRVVCADVLEHLADPERLLGQVRGLLAPGGRLLLSVPNVAYAGVVAELLAGDFHYRAEGVLDATHLRFFTRRSLLEMLARQGWAARSVVPVYRDLHDSEFRSYRLDALPPAVLRQLTVRPDALAYQFLVEAVPADAVHEARTDPHPEAAEERPLDLFVAQLYWRTGEIYSEAASVRAVGRIGEDPQTLHFPLPDDPAPAALRLDPADRPGFLRLYALRLRDARGKVRWAWDGQAVTLAGCARQALEPVPGLTGVPHVVCRLTGDDSFLILPIPEHILQCCGAGAHVEMTASWPLSPDYLACEARRPGRWQLLGQAVRDHAVARLDRWRHRLYRCGRAASGRSRAAR